MFILQVGEGWRGVEKKQIISRGDCTQLKGEVETDHCDGVQIEAETAVIYINEAENCGRFNAEGENDEIFKI